MRENKSYAYPIKNEHMHKNEKMSMHEMSER